jgi:hypothetical protein
VSLLATAAWTLRVHPVPSSTGGDAPAYGGLWLERPNSDSLMLAAAAIADGNLFRANRRAGAVFPASAPPDAVVASKPQLVLRGVVGGPPWEVLLEGLPGREGTTVMRLGQEIAGVTPISVRPGTATLRGYDTLWTLTFRPAP